MQQHKSAFEVLLEEKFLCTRIRGNIFRRAFLKSELLPLNPSVLHEFSSSPSFKHLQRKLMDMDLLVCVRVWCVYVWRDDRDFLEPSDCPHDTRPKQSPPIYARCCLFVQGEQALSAHTGTRK